MLTLFLAPGFEEIEAITPIDLCRRAGLDVITVGVGGKNITGSHSITVEADISDGALDLSPALQGVILPGGMPGSQNLAQSPAVEKTLRYCFDRNLLIAAICAAPTVPGRLGLLRGKRAVCYPGYENQLDGAIFTDLPVVRDGQFITAKAAGAAADFALEIITVLQGPDAAKKVSESIFLNH